MDDPPHEHTGVGMKRLGQKEVNHYTSGTLSRCLNSLPPFHLNFHYNSSLHSRDWLAYAFLCRLNGSDHVMRQQKCVKVGTGLVLS